ncbi:aminoglycoside phosphotransferase family protein [Paenibacillus sp. J2TS4]|uniref:aminoglycoside phosphotransferase family protein n=1 Tax=Paenibacillus sp. J2TS4 TaxID=2807194 RepID=UPI001B0BF807|nr:aminoglycoside phosphotransferase family protein [Paenibacillus sp. J2TS4]GIP31280.1 hypothetical protein J2TS4_04900 [Paenibacillus sp. J2TS4]
MSDTINEKVIYKKWEEYGFDKSFRKFFGGDGRLDKRKIKCLKNSLAYPYYKSGVWKLQVTVKKRSFPVILKVIKKGRRGNEIEINMYRKAGRTLQDVIPQIYSVRSDGDYIWVLTEHVQPIDEQIEFHPKYFLKVIPGLAKMHSRTFNKWNRDLYGDWLPFYHSEDMKKEREQMMEQTLRYLDEGMKQADLKAVLKPHYHMLQKIYKKGPIFFPQVIKAGQCITHNDLQMRNVGCNNMSKSQWNVKFLDWESAKYIPCWFDVVSLIGVFFGYRQDFKNEEDRILKQCVRLYAHEMQKHGVKFRKDPMKLYKMAYLQRVLEYDLYYHITKGLDRKEITLLPVFLEKIKEWGKELRLY